MGFVEEDGKINIIFKGFLSIYVFFFVLFDFCLKSMVKYYENKVVCMVSEDLDKYWM